MIGYGYAISLMSIAEILILYALGVTFKEFRVAMLETGDTGKYDFIVMVLFTTTFVMLPYAELLCFRTMEQDLQEFANSYSNELGHLVTEG